MLSEGRYILRIFLVINEYCCFFMSQTTVRGEKNGEFVHNFSFQLI